MPPLVYKVAWPPATVTVIGRSMPGLPSMQPDRLPGVRARVNTVDELGAAGPAAVVGDGVFAVWVQAPDRAVAAIAATIFGLIMGCTSLLPARILRPG